MNFEIYIKAALTYTSGVVSVFHTDNAVIAPQGDKQCASGTTYNWPSIENRR